MICTAYGRSEEREDFLWQTQHSKGNNFDRVTVKNSMTTISHTSHPIIKTRIEFWIRYPLSGSLHQHCVTSRVIGHKHSTLRLAALHHSHFNRPMFIPIPAALLKSLISHSFSCSLWSAPISKSQLKAGHSPPHPPRSRIYPCSRLLVNA